MKWATVNITGAKQIIWVMGMSLISKAQSLSSSTSPPQKKNKLHIVWQQIKQIRAFFEFKLWMDLTR